jgi:four helix bundle protein
MDLVTECYRASAFLPKTETFGLSSQLQRAAVSVPANIAEGHGRKSTKEYIKHLSIAYGSLMEAETHIQIAERVKYLDAATVQQLLTLSHEVGRMLNGLITSLRRKLASER